MRSAEPLESGFILETTLEKVLRVFFNEKLKFDNGYFKVAVHRYVPRTNSQPDAEFSNLRAKMRTKGL